MPAEKSTKIVPTVCLSESRDEWKIIRECYVKSFFNYPLYKYIEPDPLKRENFLRAYMDANYDVAVGVEEGIVLAVRIPADNKENDNAWKTIGGALLVPPSNDGCGWAAGSDEPYWEAYEKYGMRTISKEAMERVKRYEAWENENIVQKVSGIPIPLWNGLFCALDPEYTSRGIGTNVYTRGVKIMTRHWFKICQNYKKSSKKPNILCRISEDSKSSAKLSKLMRSISFDQSAKDKMLSHRSCSQDSLFNNEQAKTIKLSSENEQMKQEAPLAIVMSHSERSAHFHCANGFHPITKIPFYDPVAKITPFSTHILVYDPFNTGKIKQFASELNSLYTNDNNNGNELCEIRKTNCA